MVSEVTCWLMLCDDASAGGRELGARAVVVDAIDELAVGFHRHFGFHDLDETRPWRRLSDIADAVGD